MGKKLKNKYGVERLTTRSPQSSRGGCCVPPAWDAPGLPGGSTGPGQPLDLCRPPFLCATSMVLSFTLLRTWAVDVVPKEGEEGKTKRIRVRTDGPGRAAIV